MKTFNVTAAAMAFVTVRVEANSEEEANDLAAEHLAELDTDMIIAHPSFDLNDDFDYQAEEAFDE